VIRVNQIIGLKLSEQLKERIEERIAVGAYAPGARLDELELATEFGVSRTPIREALIQLSAAGFVEIRPRRGAIVAAVPPDRLREMFDVMGELEAVCARLAAARSTPEDRRALSSAHEACEPAVRADDTEAFYRLNEQFHLALYRACHNGFLTEQATALHQRLRTYRRLQLRVPGRMRASFSEHGSVVEAVLRGDGELAAARVRAHVQVQGDRFADLVMNLAEPHRDQQGG
jgi:DNA-binding GntR family transcriptional regulator